MTALPDNQQRGLNARRRYAKSLKYRDLVQYTTDAEVVAAPFLAFTKDRLFICVCAGNARKYFEISRLVLPAVPPKARKKPAAKKSHPIPASMRGKLGLM